MNSNEENVPSTSRLNFGQKATDDVAAKPAPEAVEAAEVETSTEVEETAPEAPTTEEEFLSDAVVTEDEKGEQIVADPETVVETEVTDPVDADVEETAKVEIEAPTAVDGKSVEDMISERAEIDRKIKERTDNEKAVVIDQIKGVAATYNITADELVEAMGGLTSKRKGVKAKPKYRDPATGALWSGRGKTPLWLKDKNKEDFLIPETE